MTDDGRTNYYVDRYCEECGWTERMTNLDALEAPAGCPECGLGVCMVTPVVEAPRGFDPRPIQQVIDQALSRHKWKKIAGGLRATIAEAYEELSDAMAVPTHIDSEQRPYLEHVQELLWARMTLEQQEKSRARGEDDAE